MPYKILKKAIIMSKNIINLVTKVMGGGSGRAAEDLRNFYVWQNSVVSFGNDLVY